MPKPDAPILFEIEEGHPFFSSGNIIDGATELHRFALFLRAHFAEDENELELRTALHVLTQGTGQMRDALDAYHTAVTEWRELEDRLAAARAYDAAVKAQKKEGKR